MDCIAVFLCGVRWRNNRAPNLEPRFNGQFRTSLRKDSVANYASISTLFSISVTGPSVFCNALNMAPQDLHNCGRNFAKRNESDAEFAGNTLVMVIIDIVINTILGRLTLDPPGMHCPSLDDAFENLYFVRVWNPAYIHFNKTNIPTIRQKSIRLSFRYLVMISESRENISILIKSRINSKVPNTKKNYTII